MIIGAGLAGLIAAHIFPREFIIEAAEEPAQMHHALLRFRTDAISRITGIPFRKVRVRKGIYYRGQFHQPDVRLANLYSQKCLGKTLGDRSIWAIDAADRFVAPESLYEQLIDAVGSRIEWGREADFAAAKNYGAPFISTAPLPVVLRGLGHEMANIEFLRAPITVKRFRIDDCDVFQTVYFPDFSHSMYRASITGNLLICEFEGYVDGDWEVELFDAFALSQDDIQEIGTTRQNYGKIAPIDEGLRKTLIHELTAKHNIYSLGRYATWRNILLDDVVDDAAVVKRLLHASDYDRKLAAI